mmetsp:Transcript_24408/g.44788  ORF Transcript_24408/g.44788 Transcript_24408/m.44788 type:complete len:473 (+) Transcript_24408:78-1496(+)
MAALRLAGTPSSAELPPTPFSNPTLYISRVVALYSASIVVFLGSLLEIYDWAIYGYLEPLLANVFTMSDRMGWVVFGVPFLARPVGAILMGWVADRHGRALALNLCVWLMGLATCLQGCLLQSLPGAHLIFALLRLLSGVAAGGQAASIVTYASEVGEEHGGHLLVAAAGLANGSGALAFLLATATALLIASQPVEVQLAWGWRIPFLSAGPLAFLSYYLRAHVSETPTYERLNIKRTSIRLSIAKAEAGSYGSAQALELLKEEVDVAGEARAIFLAYFAVMPAVVSNYLPMLMLRWLQVYAAFSQSSALWIGLLAKCTQAIATFPVGFIADELGTTTGLMIGSLGMLLCSVPAFLMLMEITFALQSDCAAIVMLGMVLPVCSSFCLMCSYIFVTSLFPVHRRSICVGITSGLSSATVGMVPLAWISLSQTAPWLPGASYSLLFVPTFLSACYGRYAARRKELTVYQRPWLF